MAYTYKLTNAREVLRQFAVLRISDSIISSTSYALYGERTVRVLRCLSYQGTVLDHFPGIELLSGYQPRK